MRRPDPTDPTEVTMPLHRTRTAVLLVVVAAGVLAPAAPAAAHGIGGDAAHRSVLGFVPLGFEHMVLGWDHLLFVAGVLVIARDGWRAAELITVFVLGHSTTLVLATLAGWRVDPGAVDVVIGLSVVLVGLLGMFATTIRWGLFAAVVGGFGLVHGLGLSTRLQDLGLPEEGVLWRVLAFNAGIELGQLTAILAMAVLGLLVDTLVDASGTSLRRLASVGVFAGGAAATAIVAFQTFSTPADDVDLVAGESDRCTVEPRTTPLPAAGGHVQQSFFGPAEEAPLGDFGHSVGDGYIAVLYPADLPAADVEELRTWVEGEAGVGVLAGAHPDGTEQVQALTARDQLSCDGLDVAALEEFRTAWFASR
ncbi:HupE/UreJ family protein [Nocardioides coralli]|uniref:HupE/UreJ family protein n=1 Tax=Nocardioides coralli TaxID=2872154 RepID=UPI001CA44D7A|nr:HupE/UreJ family protein [Nocardioides coralli]QZY29318.1 HupE/UreJ family protein [Nocardioides coralli]